jgi:hypothetical protein
MASYGQLGWHLNSEPVEVLVQPSHVDGVAGMKPLGEFYFYQAMVVGIPAVFLAVWWFLFPIWPRDYSHWEDSYVDIGFYPLTWLIREGAMDRAEKMAQRLRDWLARPRL